MQEVEAMEFYERVVDENTSSNSRTRVLEHTTGAALEVEIQPVGRDDLFDQIKRLPDEMKEVLAGAEDPEEAQEQAKEEDMLTGVDGETIRTFEDICVMGLEHPELTEHNFEQMVRQFGLEVLFPIGAEIMEISFEQDGSVTDFHEPDSDKNS